MNPTTQLCIVTNSRSCFIDITDQIQKFIGASQVKDGHCLIYVPHTTAGVTINEGADPTVAVDIINSLENLVPWQNNYLHLEGNSAAHIKALLVGHSQLIPVQGGRLALGTWQTVFFCEFDGPRRRKVIVSIRD